eukprot:1261346-Rhodomonas_salina.3
MGKSNHLFSTRGKNVCSTDSNRDHARAASDQRRPDGEEVGREIRDPENARTQLVRRCRDALS